MLGWTGVNIGKCNAGHDLMWLRGCRTVRAPMVTPVHQPGGPNDVADLCLAALTTYSYK